MATAQHDLWPNSFSAVVHTTPPVVILREQADLLGKKTKGLVLAEVRSGIDYDSNVVVVNGGKEVPLLLSFHLIAPALENYRYQLFRVAQSIEMYPLTIKDSPIGSVEIESEEQFIEALKKIFASEKTQKVIQSLIAQSL